MKPEFTQIKKELEALKQKYILNTPEEIRLSNGEIVDDMYVQVCKASGEEPDENLREIEKINYIYDKSKKDETKLEYFEGYKYLDVHDLNVYSLNDDKAFGKEQETWRLAKEIVSLEREMKENLLSDAGDIPYHSVLIGESGECRTVDDINNAFNGRGFAVIRNYTHFTINQAFGKTSENDILIISRKGLFTIEVKNSVYQSIWIESSGTVNSSPRKTSDRNVVEQMMYHKTNLVDLLGRRFKTTDLERFIKPVLFLRNCGDIKNDYEGIKATNSIFVLKDYINGLPDIVDEKTYTEMVFYLKKKAIEPARRRYEKKYSNYYGFFLELRRLHEQFEEAKEKTRSSYKEKKERRRKIILFFIAVFLIISSIILWRRYGRWPAIYFIIAVGYLFLCYMKTSR